MSYRVARLVDGDGLVHEGEIYKGPPCYSGDVSVLWCDYVSRRQARFPDTKISTRKNVTCLMCLGHGKPKD